MEKRKQFNIEEIDFLLNNYATGLKKDILFNIKRSWNSIQKKAHKLKIRRLNYDDENYKNNNSKYLKLLDEIPENYYWIGLLMADGHFDKQKYISISLQYKDINYINSFRTYLGMKESNKNLVSISDKITFKLLSDKFKITNHKTYEPCDLLSIKDNDLIFSLLIGFIDGDGTIDGKNIRIVSHKNWYNNFVIFNKILSKGKNKISFNVNNNLISIAVGKINILKEIKQRAIDLNLPFMKRKWDKINMSLITRNEKKEYCFGLFRKGLFPMDVIKLGIVKRSCAYNSYKNYKEIIN